MNDAEKLTKENEELRKLVADQERELKVSGQKILTLEEYIRSLKHKQFGSSSEKSDAQTELFNEAEQDSEAEEVDTTEDIEVPAHKRKKKKRVSIPKNYPRQEIIHDLSDEEKVCPHDGAALKAIGEDTHEQLDIVPVKIHVIRHVHKKYACPCCKQYIVTAKKPKQPIEKSIAAPGLLAYISVNKYCDGLPLYRQVEVLKRSGIELDRTSMANWMIKCGDLVQALINRIQDTLLEQPFLHMDETPVQVLKEEDKAAQSKSYMWVMSSKGGSSPAVLFNYSPSRSGEVPKTLLGDFSGALMVDGYEGYQSVCNENSIIRLGCWAHARRKFVEAQRNQPKGKSGKADMALSFIQKLYAVEKTARESSIEERYRLRQEKSQPLLDKLKKWLDKTLLNTPPKSSLGKALSYLSNQWPRLIRYVDNGLWPIDNNAAENSIRPFVIGRKNWLFSASVDGAKASANLYSLIETAKANNLNVYDYLKHVFTMLPQAKSLEDIDKLLPWSVGSELRY